MIREELNKRRKSLMQWVWASIAAFSMVGTAYAIPAAYTKITNAASVSYKSGDQTYTAQSNMATITIAPVYVAELSGGVDKEAAPAQTIYIPYKLKNTGNVENTFTITGGEVTGTDTSAALDPNKLESVYIDANGNGQVDEGESTVDSYTLAMGDTLDLVLVYTMPSNYTDTTSRNFGVKVVATEQKTKITDSDPEDTNGDNATVNHDAMLMNTVTLNKGAVLSISKAIDEATFNGTNYTITYILTVRNTGLGTAKNVTILDAYPGTLSGDPSAEGLDKTGGDVLPSDDKNATVKENDITSDNNQKPDLNRNGSTTDETAVNVVRAVDAELPPQTTITIKFTITVPEAGYREGDSISNNFFAFEATDATGNTLKTDKKIAKSNTTEYRVGADIKVKVSDTGGATSTAVNDGADDDGEVNDVQVVDISSVGESVLFKIEIENTGNTNESFLLSTSPGTFPSKTKFTYWEANGTVPRTNEVSLSAGSKTTIGVRAQLPTDGIGASPYIAVVTATSIRDNSAKDTVKLQLNKVIKTAARNVTLAPSGVNQVASGGSVNYKHTLTNAGGQTEILYFEVSNSAGDLWGSNLVFDSDGNSSAEGEVNVDTMTADEIDGRNAEGVSVKIATGKFGSKTTVTLQPGQSIDLFNVIVAPAGQAGDKNTTIITVRALQSTGLADPEFKIDSDFQPSIVQDVTTISDAQVRLTKKVALSKMDTTNDPTKCTYEADGNFEADLTKAVNPGQCVIWEITAVNEGADDVNNVIVVDTVPEFTSFETGSLQDCSGGSCAAAANAKHDATTNEVTFYVGAGATATAGGTLTAGKKAIMRFSVKIDE